MYHFESQIEQRVRLDREGLERAYENLAFSVDGSMRDMRQGVGDAEEFDASVCYCLRYMGTQAGTVPASCRGNAERLEHLCGSVGVMWRDVRLLGDWYHHSFGVMLGLLESGKPVALLPSGPRGYVMVDPVTHTRMRVTKKTAASIKEDAVCFYRGLPQEKTTIGALLRFMLTSANVADYVCVVVSALSVMLVGMLMPLATQILYAEVIPYGMERLIVPIGVMLGGVLIARTSCNMTCAALAARISAKVGVATEAAVVARLFSMPVGFFKGYDAGNLSNRVQTVSLLCKQLFEILLGGGLSAFVSLVYLFQMAVFAPVLMLPTCIIVAMDIVAIAVTTLVNAKYDAKMMQRNSQLSGLVATLLGAINKIKLAGAEDRAFAKWAKGYASYAHAAYGRPRWIRTLPSLVTLVGLLGTVALFFFAAEGNVEVPEYMAFNVAYGQLIGAITLLAQMTTQIARIGPMLELVRPILEAEPEVASHKKPARVRSGSIELAGVSFRYNPSSPYVIKNLSFKIRPGEYVGVVGHSGCGKSTILRLLLGFERPERGVIYIDSQDISEVDVRSLRRCLGTVMQDGRLALGNLFSNITIACPSATLEDAWEAAEIAGIADDIRNMPMGMQTIVREGSGGFSGGQKQRILIARAVCGKPRVLLFDEATSALDNVTQMHVSEALAGLKCTRIVIAHRLSTVMHCDRILVINDGCVAEEGTYEELIELGGIFRELVERQRLEEG